MAGLKALKGQWHATDNLPRPERGNALGVQIFSKYSKLKHEDYVHAAILSFRIIIKATYVKTKH